MYLEVDIYIYILILSLTPNLYLILATLTILALPLLKQDTIKTKALFLPKQGYKSRKVKLEVSISV